ncbi:MAG: hypothetical protein Kow00121_63000 [Elainellaceae cyanobacterium]
MPVCPRCHQVVDTQDINCPYCRITLKAHGHPGIPLFRATGDEYLCDTCTYHEDDTCNFPKRPYAKDCTLYHDRTATPSAPTKGYQPSWQASVQRWFRYNSAWLVLAGLIAVSLVIALRQ